MKKAYHINRLEERSIVITYLLITLTKSFNLPFRNLCKFLERFKLSWLKKKWKHTYSYIMSNVYLTSLCTPKNCSSYKMFLEKKQKHTHKKKHKQQYLTTICWNKKSCQIPHVLLFYFFTFKAFLWTRILFILFIL